MNRCRCFDFILLMFHISHFTNHLAAFFCPFHLQHLVFALERPQYGAKCKQTLDCVFSWVSFRFKCIHWQSSVIICDLIISKRNQIIWQKSKWALFVPRRICTPTVYRIEVCSSFTPLHTIYVLRSGLYLSIYSYLSIVLALPERTIHR